MAGWTNRGKNKVLRYALRGEAFPAQFKLVLTTAAVAPTATVNTFADLANEVTSANGYTTGGLTVARNTTDWDTQYEDDASNLAYVQAKDQSWTASGGTLPSGAGARYAVMVDGDVALAGAEVYYWWDLSSDRSVASGSTFTLQNLELRLTE